MTKATTNRSAQESLFIVVRDPVTNIVTRFAVPANVQIGLSGNPAELQLTGRLTLAPRVVMTTSDNQGIFNISNNDTAIGVVNVITPATSIIRINLPGNPREGEVHFITDASMTASTVRIDIYAQSGYLIKGVSYTTISVNGDALGMIWLNSTWCILSGGGGGGAGVTGATGPAGPTGATGPAGPAGERGRPRRG